MLPEFNQLIGIPYDKKRGPMINQPDIRLGVNCQRLVHACYSLLGVNLPLGLWSEEIFFDNIFFDNIDLNTPLRLVDIFCFGQAKSKPTELHLGLYTGEKDQEVPIIIHATYPDGVKYDKLDKLLTNRKYSKIYGIRRLKPEYFKYHIQPFINKYQLL